MHWSKTQSSKGLQGYSYYRNVMQVVSFLCDILLFCEISISKDKSVWFGVYGVWLRLISACREKCKPTRQIIYFCLKDQARIQDFLKGGWSRPGGTAKCVCVCVCGGGVMIAPVGEKLLIEHTKFSATRGGDHPYPPPPLDPPLRTGCIVLSSLLFQTLCKCRRRGRLNIKMMVRPKRRPWTKKNLKVVLQM